MRPETREIDTTNISSVDRLLRDALKRETAITVQLALLWALPWLLGGGAELRRALRRGLDGAHKRRAKPCALQLVNPCKQEQLPVWRRETAPMLQARG